MQVTYSTPPINFPWRTAEGALRYYFEKRATFSCAQSISKLLDKDLLDLCGDSASKENEELIWWIITIKAVAVAKIRNNELDALYIWLYPPPDGYKKQLAYALYGGRKRIGGRDIIDALTLCPRKLGDYDSALRRIGAL